MTLYEKWKRAASNSDDNKLKIFWNEYTPKEQKIYEDILENKITELNASVSELAEKYNMEEYQILGFIDGINGALEKPLDTSEMHHDSQVTFTIDFERLYKKMVECKVEHLYTLSQWNGIFDKEKQSQLYEEQKRSGTVVKERKLGRNELCTCGSGKKYKHCCLKT